jgi:hypothetical protein
LEKNLSSLIVKELKKQAKLKSHKRTWRIESLIEDSIDLHLILFRKAQCCESCMLRSVPGGFAPYGNQQCMTEVYKLCLYWLLRLNLKHFLKGIGMVFDLVKT